MAKITAKGTANINGYTFKTEIVITGDKTVENIKCDDYYFKHLAMNEIKQAGHYLANAYHPPANSMLQAYAFMEHYFHSADIEIEGDIGTIPCEEGVIY